MKVKSFCGFELKIGAIIIAMISIVVSMYCREKLMDFYGSHRQFSVQTVRLGSVTIKEKEMLGMTVRDFCVPEKNYIPRCYTFSLFIPSILDSMGSIAVVAFPFLNIPLSGLLIYGAIRDESLVMLPWLIMMGFSLIMNFITSAVKIISACIRRDLSIVIVDTICIYVLVAYFVIVVYSCYKQTHTGPPMESARKKYIHPGATASVIVI